MSIQLREHNKIAYEKVSKMLNEGDRTAVVHPTGTGKSFIALKLIEENQDKKVLYLAPSNPILHQIKENILASEKKMFRNLTRMNYQKLAAMTDDEIAELDVDIVVLDEFHHCGAPQWGRAVSQLIEENPNAKILGLSATPIRYFDGNVDMAEALFGDKIASEMSFNDAIERGILPEFEYVSALYGYEKSLRELKARIDDSTVAQSKKRLDYTNN